MKKLLCAFFLNSLLFPLVSHAAVINFECTVQNAGAKYDDYVSKTSNSSKSSTAKTTDSNKGWWKFWGNEKESYKLIFSVEGDTNEVLYPLDTIVEVLPAVVTFKEYSPGEVLNSVYAINLQDGKVNGEKFAVDSSYEPHFKKGDKLWDVKGTCEKTL